MIRGGRGKSSFRTSSRRTVSINAVISWMLGLRLSQSFELQKVYFYVRKLPFAVGMTDQSQNGASHQSHALQIMSGSHKASLNLFFLLFHLIVMLSHSQEYASYLKVTVRDHFKVSNVDAQYWVLHQERCHLGSTYD